MTRFCDLDIERIARALAARTLPKSAWTHAAHFAAALWLLRERGLPACQTEMPALIRAYNEAIGVPNTDIGGFHATITSASLRAADAWLRARAAVPLSRVLDELLAGEYGRSDWPLEYWSRARRFSREARRGWVGPDLRPLPF